MIYNREGRFAKLAVWSEMHRIGTEESAASEEVWAIQEKHWNDKKRCLEALPGIGQAIYISGSNM